MTPVRFLASARSNFNCRWSHFSALPPNTRSSLMAISGDIPDLPVNKLESACRLTPKISAPAVTDRPLRSRHSCRTSTPGCCSFTDIVHPPCPNRHERNSQASSDTCQCAMEPRNRQVRACLSPSPCNVPQPANRKYISDASSVESPNYISCNSNLSPFKSMVHAFKLKCHWHPRSKPLHVMILDSVG